MTRVITENKTILERVQIFITCITSTVGLKKKSVTIWLRKDELLIPYYCYDIRDNKKNLL